MSDPNQPSYPSVPPTVPASPWAPAPPPPPEPAAAPKRSIGKPVAIAVGVVALAGAGVFAFQSFTGDERGAASPEEAATRLADAVADEDVLGVVDLLPEGERDLLRDITTQARDEYQRLGVLSDTFSLDGFQGVDIVAEDIEVDVDEITEGLAVVTITDGSFSVEVDGDELVGNLGDVVETIAEERDVEIEVDDVEEEADADELEASFAVIEEDGRWFPSIGFTIAELGRQFDASFDDEAETADPPDLDDGVEPEGAASPEAAIQALLDAGTSLDPEAAIAVLDPGEMRALQVYSQFFELERGESDTEIEAELTDAEVDDLGGGASRVVPTGLEVRFETDDGSTGEVVLEDGCVNVDIQPPDGDDGPPFEEEFCFGEDGELLGDEVGEVEVPEELQDVAEAFQPIRLGVVTVERDGEHFVAPIRTVADLLLGVTRGLEPEDLEEGGTIFDLLSGELDDDVEELVDEVAEETVVVDEEVFDDEFFDDDAEEDCEGVGCGFEDELDPREPTGASGPNGELLVFDAVEGTVAEGAVATFTAVADIDDDFVIGVQGVGDFDSVVAVFDAATGELLNENDDFNGVDPEVLVTLTAGQEVTIEVRGFADAGGDFLVYFEPF
jgi:hypothetical protein